MVAGQSWGKYEGIVMPQVASAHVEQVSDVAIWEQLPFNAQRDALRRVGERLLIIADNPATQWTDQGRIDARRCAHEMLRQAGEGASVERSFDG
jgi:hypothetical protein